MIKMFFVDRQSKQASERSCLLLQAFSCALAIQLMFSSILFAQNIEGATISTKIEIAKDDSPNFTPLENATVAPAYRREGIILLPCKVTTEFPYTHDEWEKIKKLASRKGKIYKTAKEAKKHVEAL